jgi:hypothetical protein
MLSGPGDLFETYKHTSPPRSVRREPLVYSPSSTSSVNHPRLPQRHQLVDMELAYREQAFSDADLRVFSRRWISAAFLITLGTTVALLIAGEFLPLRWIPILGVGITIVGLLFMQLSGHLTLRTALLCTLGPLVLLTTAKASGSLLSNRLFASALFGLVTFAVVARSGRSPLEFYRDWIYTHPRLRPETRRNAPRPGSPNLIYLGVLLAIVVLVGSFSTGLAMLAAVVASIAMVGGISAARDRLRTAQDLLAQFLLYGRQSTYAPGVWICARSSRLRARLFLAIMIPFVLTLLTGLSMFFPDTELLTWTAATREVRQAGELTTWEVATRSPTDWCRSVTQAIDGGQFLYFWAIPGIVLASLVIPPLMLLAVYARPLRTLADMRRGVDGDPADADSQTIDADGRPEWQWYVDRLSSSSHISTDPLGGKIREAEHMFVGVEPYARFPVLLDQSILAEHAYFVGDSGSGKTSLGIMPLLIQLMRGHRDDSGQPSPCPPIVILDLKGDPALFHLAKNEAENRGAEFRFFTPESKQPCHYFNPFLSMANENRTDIQLANLVLDALSLNHGEGYGRGYYARQSRQLLYDAIRHHSRPRSFGDLYKVITEMRKGDPDSYRDTFELISTIHALQSYPQLAVTRELKKPEQAIHMPSVLERSQVVYFWLPAAVESVSVREIGKLALYSLMTAAIDRQRTRPRDEWRQAYVIIDEFQRIAAENFRVILEQARSFKLATILANQSVDDLKTPDVDLRPAVRNNTRMKRYFSITSPDDIQALSDLSGLELAFIRNWSQKGELLLRSLEFPHNAFTMHSDTQAFKNRLIVNDILAASDHPLDSIFHVSRGSGYTQFAGMPIAVRSTWPLLQKDYEELQDEPWPDVDAYEQDEVGMSDTSPQSIDQDRTREAADKLRESLTEMLAENA